MLCLLFSVRDVHVVTVAALQGMWQICADACMHTGVRQGFHLMIAHGMCLRDSFNMLCGGMINVVQGFWSRMFRPVS